MYKSCKTEASTQRQLQFAQSLLDLLETHPFCQITVQQLCRAAGTPRNAFYRYFNNMDDVVDLLIDSRMIWEYAAYIERCARDNAFTDETEMERLFTYWQGQRRLLTALEKNQMTARLLERVVQHYQHENTNAYRMRFGADAETMRMSITFSVFGVQALLLEWHRNGYCPPAGEMARRALRLLTEPLFCRHNPAVPDKNPG